MDRQNRRPWRGPNPPRPRNRNATNNGEEKTVFEIAREQYNANGQQQPGRSSNRSNRSNRRNRGRRDGSPEAGHHEDRPPSRNNQRSKNQKMHPIGFQKLEELTTKSPAEVVFSVNSNKNGFKELLNEDFIGNDKISKCLQVISVACQCEHKENRSVFLENLLKECEKFFNNHLIKYLLEMQNSVPTAYRLQSMQHLLDTIETFQTIHPQISLMTTQLLLPQARASITRLTNTLGNGQALLERLDTLDATKNSLLDSYNSVFSAKKTKDDAPNNFREIPIFPDKHDLINNKRPFLRPNIVEGRYDDADHYLDVQFRLLREDFIRPLREGIGMYLEQIKNPDKNRQRLQDIKVYKNVKLCKIILTNEGVVHGVTFDINLLRNVRWESSKRLIYGALVCLTFDNFETVYFGTVSDRDIEKLKAGQVGIKFENQDEMIDVKSETFTMVETEAYFEASRHVLSALQNIEESNFPMKEYIVELRKKVEKPEYLKDNTVYCMSTLVHMDSFEGIRLQARINVNFKVNISDLTCPCRMMSKQVPVLLFDNSTWMTEKDFDLDPSQYQALKSALTQKMSIIQGPPGTGKTYVGLKIIRALLHNQKIWNESDDEEKNPILIVCYTNHALDQFLEGVLKETDQIVRMGGRSNSEVLKPYTMNNLKRVYSRNLPGGNQMGRHFRNMKSELEHILQTIKAKEHQLKLVNKEVLSEVDLMEDMDKIHYKSFIDDAPKFLKLSSKHLGDIMQFWLGLKIPPHLRNVIDENALIVYDDRKIEVPDFFEDEYESDQEIDKEEELNLDEEDYEDVLEAAVTAENVFPEPENWMYDDYSDDDEIDYIQDQRLEDSEENRNHFVIGINDSESDEEENDGEWKTQGGKKQRQKFLMRKLNSSNVLTENELLTRRNIWSLQMDDRWRLYKTWSDNFKTNIQIEIDTQKREYERKLAAIGEAKTEEEIIVAKSALVIGMTTTGAAKYRHLINSIRSKIVIVEEAAEILEAQILTSLSKYTRHLILIGDHQQLRPNPVVYELAKKYNLEISLFERLINNGIPFVRLGIQHRMKPDISRLLVPHIYQNLQDHQSVFEYEEITGFEKSVYFVSHKHHEIKEADSTSRVNTHEAQFLVSLCRYILQQGYQPSQITILTTYLGQLFTIKRLLTGSLKEVRATVVDNYQGEENDIILISFVRSNEDGTIGFLKTENRVCVALSRAKKGLFCVGNFELFAEKSNLWTNISTELAKSAAIGQRLTLKCKNHQNLLEVASSYDFNQVSDGGCREPCDFRLSCGHVCGKKCHPLDQEHKEVKCAKPCEKLICRLQHMCRKRCHEPCGACNVQVLKTVPKCGHETRMPCHADEKQYICKEKCPKTLSCGHDCSNFCGELCSSCRVYVNVIGPCFHNMRVFCMVSKDDSLLKDLCARNCDKILPCGHICDQKCGKPCQSKCFFETEVQLDCGHKIRAPCYKLKDTLALRDSCLAKCNAILKCDHNCSGTCGKCFQGRLHVPCNRKCQKILVCGHNCRAPCSSSCPPCGNLCENRCPHSQCKQSCGYPCASCREKCMWQCKHHTCNALCGEVCVRPPCNRVCKKILQCQHPCVGMCGEPCPRLCRICNRDELQEVFFGHEDHEKARFLQLEDCGHVIEIRGLTKWVKEQSHSSEVKVLSCPLCKTPIRRNLRFGNEVKTTLSRIETIKEKVFGVLDENEKKQKNLSESIGDYRFTLTLPIYSVARSLVSKYNECLDHMKIKMNTGHPLDHESLVIHENYLNILKAVKKVEDSLNENRLKTNDTEILRLFQKAQDFSSYSTTKIIERIMKPVRQTNQIILDMTIEMRRLQSLANLFKDFGKTREKGSLEAKKYFDSILDKLLIHTALTEADFDNIDAMKKKLLILSEGAVIGVSPEEKVQILQAMALKQGHWYTCPNGHVYCITECGGAMQEGRCNECNAVIGGGSHRLRDDNRLARAMDGATHSAWSEQVDLANYRLDDI